MAPSDAHILLSPYNAPAENASVYEIVIGAGKNTFSSIRKLRSSINVNINTTSILNVTDLKTFWIRLNKKVIDVGQGNSSSPFLRLVDRNYLDVNYISFGAWVGVTATWVYDCSNITSSKMNTEKKVQIEKLEGISKLKMDLFAQYDPNNVRMNREENMTVITSVDVNHIDLDLKKNQLVTLNTFTLKWTDSKMIWDPSNYNNITSLKLDSWEIWHPDLFIFNFIQSKSIYIYDNQSKIIVRNNGHVLWRLNTPQLSTICGTSTADLTYWPWELSTCRIRIGIQPYSIPIILALDKLSMKPLTNTVANDWKVNCIKLLLEKTVKEEMSITNNDNTLVIVIELKPYPSTFIYIFCLPIICAAVISQFTFLLPLECLSRMFLHCISLVIFSIYLLVLMGKLPAPTNSSPIIVSVCSRFLSLIALQTLVTAFIMNFAKFNENYTPSHRIKKLLGKKIIKRLFLLPSQDSCYNELKESTNQSNQINQTNWFIFSIVLDRIMFITSIFIIVANLIIIMANYKEI